MKIVKLLEGPIRLDGRLFDAGSVLALDPSLAYDLVVMGFAEPAFDPWLIRNPIPPGELDRIVERAKAGGFPASLAAVGLEPPSRAGSRP